MEGLVSPENLLDRRPVESVTVLLETLPGVRISPSKWARIFWYQQSVILFWGLVVLRTVLEWFA